MNPDAFDARLFSALEAAEVHFRREQNLANFNPQYLTDFRAAWLREDPYRTGVLLDIESIRRLAQHLCTCGWADWMPSENELRTWAAVLAAQRSITAEQILEISENPDFHFVALPQQQQPKPKPTAHAAAGAFGGAASAGGRRTTECPGQHFVDPCPANCAYLERERALAAGGKELFQYATPQSVVFGIVQTQNQQQQQQLLFYKSPVDWLCDCPRDALAPCLISRGFDSAGLRRVVRALHAVRDAVFSKNTAEVRDVAQQFRQKGEGIISVADGGLVDAEAFPAVDNRLQGVAIVGACLSMNGRVRAELEEALAELVAECRSA